MLKYVTAAEVGRMLSCTPNAARKWLSRNGLSPLSLGVGRGLGLRWNIVEVEASIAENIIERPAKKEKQPKRPPLSRRPLVGKSIKEQLALIAGGSVQ